MSILIGKASIEPRDYRVVFYIPRRVSRFMRDTLSNYSLCRRIYTVDILVNVFSITFFEKFALRNIIEHSEKLTCLDFKVFLYISLLFQ